MARRTNTAEGDDEIMQYFFGGGGGGQQTIDPMASAMQLLGFGQTFAQEDRLARAQAALEAQQQRNEQFEREKLSQSEAFERDKLAAMALQNRVKFAQDVITNPSGTVPQDVGMGMLEGLPPEYSDPLKKVMAARMGAAVEKVMPYIREAYKDPKKTAAALKLIFEHPEAIGTTSEVLKQVPFQQLNEAIVPPPPPSGLASVLNTPWQEYKAPPDIPNPWTTIKPVVPPEQALPWQRPATLPTGVNAALPWR